MKRQIRNEYELVGKTIAHAETLCTDDLFLRFTDDTFAYMEARIDLGECYLSVNADFRPRFFDVATLERLSVLSAEEMDERVKQEREYAEEETARDRSEYERLRAKFEGG